ncbi:helix-turn-helix transcriptional regulator [Candidatus Pacearchaeota archaeon]|nr:helix-turn-helix transcriptional regulator [Candidatus Pacearchaeota archaeon]
MKRECSVRRAVNFLGKRWTLLILLELYKGNSEWKRFSHIKKNLDNITSKILSIRLRELENENLIEKRVNIIKFPIKSEYKLTKAGKDFIRIIKGIKRWSLIWKKKNKTCKETDCKDCEF